MQLRSTVRDTERLRQILTTALMFSLVSLVVLYFSSTAIVADSDSGYRYRDAKGYLTDGHLESGPVMSQIVYAQFLAAFDLDYSALVVVQGIFSILLILTTYLMVRKKTGHHAVALLSSLLFFQFFNFFWGTYTMKEYPMFLFFAVSSIYFFDRSLTTRNSKMIFISSLFMALSYMTHILATFGIAVPLVYYLFCRVQKKRMSFTPVLQFYLFLVILLAPYLTWRILNDGWQFYHYPNTWGILRYGRMLNIEFWNMPDPFTTEYYARVLSLVGTYLFSPLLLILFIVAVIRSPERTLIVSWLVALFIPFYVSNISPIYVYMYPMMPALILAAGLGLKWIIGADHHRAVAVAIVILIFALAVGSVSIAASNFERRQADAKALLSDMEMFQSVMEPNKKVLFRSYAISPLLPRETVLMLTGDIAEEDAVTYLNWTSEEAVSAVMEKYGIRYVILYKDVRWERDFHIFFNIREGHPPNHYIKIEDSPNFEMVLEGGITKLFRYAGG